MFDRRSFLGSAAAAGIAQPIAAQALTSVPLPAADLHGRNQDAYWAALRKQFLIPADVVNLNVGTVGSSPRPVLKAIFDGFEQTEQMTQAGSDDYPIWGYGAWEQYRKPFADFMGAQVDQMAILRNCRWAKKRLLRRCRPMVWPKWRKKIAAGHCAPTDTQSPSCAPLTPMDRARR